MFAVMQRVARVRQRQLILAMFYFISLYIKRLVKFTFGHTYT